MVPLQATMSTSLALGAIYCPATSMRRFRLWDAVFGCEGTPGDTAMTLRIQRSTGAPTVGNGTAVTPAPVDPADAAAVTLSLSFGSTSVNGTTSTTLFEIVQNQRSTVRWFAAPGEEIVVPATANNGLQYLTPTSPALSGRVSSTIDE